MDNMLLILVPGYPEVDYRALLLLLQKCDDEDFILGGK